MGSSVSLHKTICTDIQSCGVFKSNRVWPCVLLRYQSSVVLCGGKGTESFQAENFGGVSSLNCISSIQKALIFVIG